jgi:hypothetical protein
LRRIKYSGRKIFTQFNALIIYEESIARLFFGTRSGICRKQLQSAKKAELNDIYIFLLVKANSPFVEEKKFEQNSSPCLLNALKAEKVSNFFTRRSLSFWLWQWAADTEYTLLLKKHTKESPILPGANLPQD